MLLRRADLSVPVEPSQLGVPPDLAATVMDELAGTGVLAQSGSGWVVVPPELAIEALTARAEERLEVR